MLTSHPSVVLYCMPVVAMDQVEYCFWLSKNGDKLSDVTHRAVQSLRGLTSGDRASNKVKQSHQQKDVQKYKAGC